MYYEITYRIDFENLKDVKNLKKNKKRKRKKWEKRWEAYGSWKYSWVLGGTAKLIEETFSYKVHKSSQSKN